MDFCSDAVIGVNNSKMFIIAVEGALIGVDFSVFTNFEFAPSMDKSQLCSPITDFYQSLGINQYIQQAVMEKKFLENLFSKESWQAAAARLDKKMQKQA